MDDEDDYFDTISITSNQTNYSTKKPTNKRNLTLSRHTVYHSIPNLEEGMEMTLLDGGDANHSPKKVASCKIREVKTYEQWRNRV